MRARGIWVKIVAVLRETADELSRSEFVQAESRRRCLENCLKRYARFQILCRATPGNGQL